MRILTRAFLATGVVATLSFTITPIEANAAATTASGAVVTAVPTGCKRDCCHTNYSGKKYCNGERPYHGWSRYHDDYDGYDDYYDYEDGYYYGGGYYEEYPLVCDESPNSCRAPRRP